MLKNRPEDCTQSNIGKSRQSNRLGLNIGLTGISLKRFVIDQDCHRVAFGNMTKSFSQRRVRLELDGHRLVELFAPLPGAVCRNDLPFDGFGLTVFVGLLALLHVFGVVQGLGELDIDGTANRTRGQGRVGRLHHIHLADKVGADRGTTSLSAEQQCTELAHDVACAGILGSV